MTRTNTAPPRLPNPFVRKLESFVELSEADRAMLERISADRRSVAPHTPLVREGDKPDGVWLIQDGVTCRQKTRVNGGRQILALLLPGDLCDLDVSLLDRMDHSIVTLSPCKVIHVPSEIIADILDNVPAVACALRLSTLVDEATLREWLVNLGCQPGVKRIAHLFCELFVRQQRVGRTIGTSCALPLTQADLADATGLSNVHVNRVLQELRGNGLIGLQDRRLTIPNLAALSAFAEFEPGYLRIGSGAQPHPIRRITAHRLNAIAAHGLGRPVPASERTERGIRE